MESQLAAGRKALRGLPRNIGYTTEDLHRLMPKGMPCIFLHFYLHQGIGNRCII